MGWVRSRSWGWVNEGVVTDWGGANERGVATELVLAGRGRGHGAGRGQWKGVATAKGRGREAVGGAAVSRGRGHVDRGRSIAEMNESDGAEWSAAQPRGRAAQGPHRAQPAGSDGPPRASPPPPPRPLCAPPFIDHLQLSPLQEAAHLGFPGQHRLHQLPRRLPLVALRPGPVPLLQAQLPLPAEQQHEAQLRGRSAGRCGPGVGGRRPPRHVTPPT